MAVFAGTKIVNDGLVFHFDLENGVKSFKGKPTSNIISSQGLGSMSLTYTYIGDENGWKKYSISGTWNSGTYPFSTRINSTVFTGGVAYSARCLLKTNVIEKFNAFGGLNYVNDPNMVSGGTNAINSLGYDEDGLEIIESKREGFIYSTGYANPTTTQTGYLLSRPIADGTVFNPSTDFVWIKEIQVEEGSFCTKYTNGIRLDTASIIDVSPTKSTITAANLTYRQDDTPTFDGTNDYLSIPQPNVQTSPNLWTIEGWIKTGNQTSFFITPNSNGIDNFLRYDASQQQLAMTVCSAADTNGRGFSTGVGSVPYNTWTHFSASIDNLDVKMHINGELKYSGTETITMSGWTGIWRIGQRGNGTYYLLGELDNLKIYNKALTDAEVKQNFEATRSRYGI